MYSNGMMRILSKVEARVSNMFQPAERAHTSLHYYEVVFMQLCGEVGSGIILRFRLGSAVSVLLF